MRIIIGTRVTYTFWGVVEIATVKRVAPGGNIVFLDNDRWMHLESLTAIEG